MNSNILGLSEREQKVLDAIKHKFSDNIKISELVKTTAIPRMTVYDILNKLTERGFLNKKRKNKHVIYSVNTKNIDLLEQIEFVEKGGAKVLHGVKELDSFWDEIIKLPPKSRLAGLQPLASVKEMMKKFDIFGEKLTQVQKSIIEKQIIIESLVTEDYYEQMYKDLIARKVKNPKQAIKGFIGRSADAVFAPVDLIKAKAEINIFPDVAYIVNWKDEVAIKIEDGEIINLFKDLLKLARAHGYKINQNEYLKKIVEKND